jgi:hypothetical protein
MAPTQPNHLPIAQQQRSTAVLAPAATASLVGVCVAVVETAALLLHIVVVVTRVVVVAVGAVCYSAGEGGVVANDIPGVPAEVGVGLLQKGGGGQ